MKKLLFLTILLALLLAGCASATPTPYQPTAIPTPVYIEAPGVAVAPEMATGIKVEVLSSPDPYARVITTLDPGQVVEVVGYVETFEWVVIKLDDGTIGWVPFQHVAVTIEN